MFGSLGVVRFDHDFIQGYIQYLLILQSVLPPVIVFFSTSSLLAQLLRRESEGTLQREGSRMDTTQALFLPYLIPKNPTLYQN